MTCLLLVASLPSSDREEALKQDADRHLAPTARHDGTMASASANRKRSADTFSAPMSAPVTKLSPYDVLLGRGSGMNEYVGNQRFRSLIDGRKKEYISCSQYEPKRRIAKSILDRVHSLGGRFLRVKEDTNAQDEFVVEDNLWEECEEAVALEKIKQRLREKEYEAKDGTSGRKKRTLDAASDVDPESVTNPPEASSGLISMNTASEVLPLVPIVPFPVLPSSIPSFPTYDGSTLSLFGSATSPLMVASTVDPRLLILPPGAFTFNATLLNRAVQIPGPSVRPDAQISAASPQPLAPVASSSTREPLVRQRCTTIDSSYAAPADYPSFKQPREGGVSTDGAIVDTDASDDVTQYILSTLALSDQAIITDEQVALEKATLTDSERAESLCDLFGHMCSVDSRESKKQRRDLDRESIDFLVKQMWAHIDAIPVDKKKALLEAKKNGRPEDFSNERLEKFLRCERMNAKLAAQRFVNYWQQREQLFGEKYLLPMTLSGALRDDEKAIRAGMYCALPRCDSSGRSMIFWDPSSHTREGYSPESMVRAVWYVTEIVAEANKHIGSGIVEIVSSSKVTIWDYDAKVYPRVVYLQENAFPVRVVAHHLCSPSNLIQHFVKPVFLALKSKSGRTRTQLHDVPEDKVAESLSSYGILDSMLPTELGGTVNLDQVAWLNSRRAIEMETEEIA